MDGWIDIYIYTNIKTIYLSISTCLHAYDLPFSLGWLSIAMVDHGGVPLWVRAFFLLPGDARHRRNVAIMRRFILHFWLIFWWNSRVQPGFPCCSKMQVPKEGRQFLHPGLQGSWLGGGFNPSEQYESQWEGWHPIHEMEKPCIKNVPSHQPVDDSIHLMVQIPFGNWFMLSWWMTSITETSPA